MPFIKKREIDNTTQGYNFSPIEWPKLQTLDNTWLDKTWSRRHSHTGRDLIYMATILKWEAWKINKNYKCIHSLMENDHFYEFSA